MITAKRVILGLVLIALLGTAALVGGMAGGGAVYWMMVRQSASQQIQSPREIPSPISQTLPVVDVQTAVTSAVDKVAPAVVTVISHFSEGGGDTFFGSTHQEVSGSGIIIAMEGYIITNRHVINGSQSLEVIFRDGQSNAVAEGLGFAVASNTVSALSNQLISQGYIVRPYLGINWEPINPTIAGTYDLPVEWGIYITGLAQPGPAAQAGLHQGDIITAINNDAVAENNPFINILLRLAPGQNVEVTFVRDGQTQITTVTLGERPRS